MAISADTPTERARQLTILTNALTERLVHDLSVLEAHRPQDLAEGMEKTRQLSNLYRIETARIKADPSLISGISDSDKSKLREATEAFQDTLARYEVAVTAARTVSEGILQTIAEDATQRKAEASPYGPGAKISDTRPQSLNFGHRA